MEIDFCVGGKQRLIEFCDENEIEYDPCGKVIVATDESELGRLDDLYERGMANGVPDLEMVGPEPLAEIEPHTYGVRALWAPHTGIVDYLRVANAYAGKFQSAGGDIFTGATVTGARRTAGGTALETRRGALQARHVINCGGLYADRLAAMMGEQTDVRIIPFRRRLSRAIGLFQAQVLHTDWGETDAALLMALNQSDAISDEEYEDLLEVDIIFAGQDTAGQRAYAVVEVSLTVSSVDVNRAARRTQTLAMATGAQCNAIVVGSEIPDAERERERARRAGVAVIAVAAPED